jgi:hypothetical protein
MRGTRDYFDCKHSQTGSDLKHTVLPVQICRIKKNIENITIYQKILSQCPTGMESQLCYQGTHIRKAAQVYRCRLWCIIITPYIIHRQPQKGGLPTILT